MNDTSQYIREVFSMLGNLCLPTIDHLIKSEFNGFINRISEVVDNKDFAYLIKQLKDFEVENIEAKHDKLNIGLVELTYNIYNVWMEFIEKELGEVYNFNYYVNEDFIDNTSDRFLTCILNQDMLNLHKKLQDLTELKASILKINIIKYHDNVIVGCKKGNDISQTFKVIRDNLKYIDADLYLHKFIDDYEHFCFIVMEAMDSLEKIMSKCMDDYIATCIDIFGCGINKLYNELEKHNLEINMIKLKIYILNYLKDVIN